MAGIQNPSLRLSKSRIQQLPLENRQSHDAIFNSNHYDDIEEALNQWSCERVILVHSKSLNQNTDIIKTLSVKLSPVLKGIKSGVGAHSPYADVLDIARLLVEHNADCLISIGSSSYSDACKIARLLPTNLDPNNLTIESMAALVSSATAQASNLHDPNIKLICVPTSLSASEWNHSSSTTNPLTRKKEHFSSEHAMPDLILLDPVLASTAPRTLWLSSGMRAVDHCVETMLSAAKCPHDAFAHMERALTLLLPGLRAYVAAEKTDDRDALLGGISECQSGSRDALMGYLLWRVPMGASHAIGHQVGSVCGVMHGVTSCVLLASVVKYTYGKSEYQRDVQGKVLGIWNKCLGWKESSLGSAVQRFVGVLGLPRTLREVGVTEKEVLEKIAGLTKVDGLGDDIKGKEEVLEILELARG